MGRLQDYWDNGEIEEDDEDGREKPVGADVDEAQKELDLLRAQARTIHRPIKKEGRHSRVEGKYIPPEEIKKEVLKLERAKKRAKMGFFERLFLSEEDIDADLPQEKTAKKKKNLSPQERREILKKKEQIDKLRGITPQDDFEDEQDETVSPVVSQKTRLSQRQSGRERESFVPKSFADSVRRLTDGERAAKDDRDGRPNQHPQVFNDSSVSVVPVVPADPVVPAVSEPRFPQSVPFSPMAAPVYTPPDETIVSGVSVAVGFVYWDETNRLVDRIVTVRRIFRRRGELLVDGFCHDISLPRMIPFSRCVRLYDARTLCPYDDPRDFLEHRVAGFGKTADRSNRFADVLSSVRYEMAALAFAARADFEKTKEEDNLILDYAKQRCAGIDYDPRELESYIAMLVPDEECFYEAADIIVTLPQKTVALFVGAFLKLIMRDGVLNENECELLAELLYILRLEGIELNSLGFE